MDRFRRERDELYEQQKELEAAKQQLEAELIAQEKHFAITLNEQQRVIDEMSLRQPSTDEHEMLKTRIAKIVSGPYQERIASMQREAEDKENAIEELKRLNKSLKAELEDAKSEHEEELRSLKKRYTRQIDELVAENQRLELEHGDSQERETASMLERRQEEYRRKYNESQNALGEANRNLNALKAELEALEKTNRKLNEQLQMQNFNTENEIEKLTDKLKRAKEEYAGEVQRGLEKDKAIQEHMLNIENLKAQIQQLEEENVNCVRREDEIKETLRERDREIEECIQQIKSETKDNSERAQDENQILIHENAALRNQLKSFEDNQSLQVQELLDKLQLGEKQAKVMYEEQQELRMRAEELQATCETLKSTCDKANAHTLKLEQEISSLQSLYRNSLVKGQELMTVKEHLELSLQLLREENEGMKGERAGWKEERGELQRQISGLARKLEGTTRESADKLKDFARKRSEYRVKLREAKLRLQQMEAQAAQLQAETQLPKLEVPSALLLKTGMLDISPDSSKLEAEIERTLQHYGE